MADWHPVIAEQLGCMTPITGVHSSRLHHNSSPGCSATSSQRCSTSSRWCSGSSSTCCSRSSCCCCRCHSCSRSANSDQLLQGQVWRLCWRSEPFEGRYTAVSPQCPFSLIPLHDIYCCKQKHACRHYNWHYRRIIVLQCSKQGIHRPNL